MLRVKNFPKISKYSTAKFELLCGEMHNFLCKSIGINTLKSSSKVNAYPREIKKKLNCG